MAIQAVAMVVLAKRPLVHALLRLLPALVWPLNLYLPRVRQLPEVCRTVCAASALLAFRLRRIVAARVPRYRRALRLLWDDGLRLRHPPRRRHMLDDSSITGLLAVAI